MSALPVLQVEGVDVQLSTYEGAQIKVEGGRVRVSLENYTGELFFTVSGNGKKRAHIEIEDDEPAESPSTVGTVKKPAHAAGSSHSRRNADSDFVLDDSSAPPRGGAPAPAPISGAARGDDEDGVAIPEPYRRIVEGGGSVSLDNPDGDGLFAFLGGKRGPVREGLISVTCSGYDPTKKKPEDLVVGRKGGDGCELTKGGDGQIWVEFEMPADLEFALTGYTLRNGCKFIGHFPKSWAVECWVGGRWVEVGEEDTHALDSNKHAPVHFQVKQEFRHADVYSRHGDVYARRVRIRHREEGGTERHRLWLSSVELFGTLRTLP
uniref:Uncharacterized protein n=1 Tax=Hemiselmis andersenii TaxID=464988 RepID=A0A6U4L3D6_HEMAN